MITILKIMIQNLIGMLMTKHMVLWGLKFAAKSTKNQIDDNVVLLADGAFNNDSKSVKLAISNLTEIYKNR